MTPTDWLAISEL